MFTFNDEYLLKSMMSLVRDESDRIVSLGLAPQKELKDFVESKLHAAIAQANGDRAVVLSVLTGLHKDLDAVRLPGDFEQVSDSAEHQVYATLEIEIPVEVTKDEEAPEEPVPEDDAKDGTESEDAADDEEIKAVCSFLGKLTYELGKKGNHEAAYLVERTIHKIAAL